MARLAPYLKDYDAREWVTLPLKHRDKAPTVKIQHIISGEHVPTPDETDRWFNDDGMNVGIAMKASGLILVDLDLYKNPDLQKWADHFPTGLTAKTARGGLHLFFQAPDQHVNNATNLAGYKGVDVKYAGYAVVAPSIVHYPDTGHTGQYEWIEFGQPAPLPPAILKLLTQPLEVEAATQKDDSFELLERVMLHGFTDGAHNTELKDLARLLVRASQTSELQDRMILTVLKALDAKDPTPQDAVGQFHPTVVSGINYERQRLEKKPATVSVQGGKATRPLMDTIGYTDFAQTYDNYHIDYLVQDWFPEFAILMMIAPPEHYKTWIGLDMAISLALGNRVKGFMGQHTVKYGDGVPVLIVQQEDYAGLVADRMKTIIAEKLLGVSWNCTADGDIDLPRLDNIFLHTEADLTFKNPDSILALEAKIRQHNIKFVYIDPFYSLVETDNFMSDAAAQMMQIKRIRNETGASFLFAHHTRKSGGEGREKMWGSQLLNGAVEGMFLISETGVPGTITFERRGKFFPGHKKVTVSFDINSVDQPFHYRTHVDTPDILLASSKSDADQEIMEWVREHPGCTQQDIAAATGMEKSKVSRRVKMLCEANILMAQGRKYYVPTKGLENI